MIATQLVVGFVAGIVVMILLRPAFSKATMWTLGATMKTRKVIKSSYNWAAALAIIALVVIIASNTGGT